MHSCGRAASSSASATASASAPPAGDAVDEPDALGLDAVDAAAGEDQVDRPAVADQPGQAHRAEVDERHAEAPAVHAEHGVDGGDAQVAPQGQLQPPGDGRALDGRDDRLAEPQPGRSHRARTVLADRAAVALGERLQVGAGAEAPAGPGEHGDGRRVVGVERLERLESRPAVAASTALRRSGRSIVTIRTGP